MNLISNFYPWIALHGSDLQGHESCTGDTVDSVMPGIEHIRSQLLSGHLANWESVVGGGSPLAGVPDLGLLDPLSLPYWFLPLWLAPAFVMLLQIVVAAGGTFLFLRQFRVSRAASILAGFIFATSGFMIEWSNWPQTRVAALIPAVFWAVERLVQRRRVRDVGLIAVVIASMLLGGFPAVTGYTLYLAAGYLIVRVVVLHRTSLREGLRTLGLAAGALVLGFLLSMVQLLPFLYFFSHSDLSYRSGDAKAGLPLSGLLTLFAPNSYGLCVVGQPNRGSVSAIELVAYIGAGALLLAIAGAAFGFIHHRFSKSDVVADNDDQEALHRRPSSSLRRPTDLRGVRGFFVVAVIAIIALGWASPTLRSVTAPLPAFADNFIGRIRSVLGFTLAVLAALGFDWLMSDRPARRDSPGAAAHFRRPSRSLAVPTILSQGWPWLVGISTIAFGLLVLRRAHEQAFTGGYERGLRDALVIPGVLLVVAAVAIAIARLNLPGFRSVACVVLPLLIAAQAAQYFHTALPGDNPSNFYPDTPTHKFLAANLGEDRFASADRTMYTATALYYGLRTPTGHVFQSPGWIKLLQAVDPKVMNTPTFSDFTPAINQTNIGHQPILAQLAVNYFVLPPTALAGQVTPLSPATGSVNAVGSVCSLPSQPIRGVTVRVADAMQATNPTRGLTLNLTVRVGNQVIASGQYIGAAVAAGSDVTIAVAGESLPKVGRMNVSFSATGAREPLTLAATGSATADCAPVEPIADGLRLVFADSGSIIYQRLTSLPRVRWDSSDTVIASEPARVAALRSGIPNDQVVLNSPGPSPSGQPATLALRTDGDDTISTQVNARGSGYLVVADALQEPGWTATVDGRTAALVPADEAMVAVFVPQGVHTVTLSYRTPGQRSGLVVSVIALIILMAVIASPGLYARRRSRRRANRGADVA